MEDHDDNLPLVVFTTLAPLAVGGTAGLLIVRGPALVAGPDWSAFLVLAVALLALAASFLHLGHPFRAYRAIVRLYSSWLSREVLLYGLFVLSLAMYSVPWFGGTGAHQTYGAIAVVLGFVGIFATGKVYQLRAHPAWNHWSTVASFPLGALSAGVALGAFASTLEVPAGARGNSGIATATTVAALFLAVSLIVTWVRLRRLKGGNEEQRLAWQLVIGQYRWALTVRTLAVAVAAVLLATAGSAIALAWLVAALGEFADRVLLFYVAVPVSPRDRAGAHRFAPIPASPTSRPSPARHA
jgi:DMSO reductase anchor subunit